MNRISIVILLILNCTISNFGQKIELVGYLTHQVENDSSYTSNEYHSKIILNEKKEIIHKEWIPFYQNNGPEVRFEFNIGTSKNICKGWVIKQDSAKYEYIHDTLSKRRYIIKNSDTSFIYQTKYDKNDRLLSQKCLVGCDYQMIYKYPDKYTDLIYTIWAKGDTSYSINYFDNEGRIILLKDLMNSPNDSIFSYIKTNYIDSLNIKTDEYGNSGWLDNKEIITTQYDDYGIIKTVKYEYYSEENYSMRLVEYDIKK
jgi:hypothetical protein